MSTLRVQRLTTCAELVRLWPNFVEWLTFVRRCLRFSLPINVYRQILQHAVRNPSMYVAVVHDDEGPVGFACAHEVTPLFCIEREYEVSMLFHKSGRDDATKALQAEFETWLNAEGVYRYVISTRRDNPSAIRCFQSARFGMKRAYTVFKKELKQ
jgi:hypothetical protein